MIVGSLGTKKTKEDRKKEKAGKRGGEEEEEKEPEKTVAETLAAAADETPKQPKPVTDDEDDDEDWAVDTSEAAVAARLKQQEEAYNKVEKANGDRDGEEELDEFELEKRAIGLKIKEAIETDETDEAVKALMAVAKEHELQCDDLFGFIFDGVLDANAVKQVSATYKGVLLKLYKASADPKKTQKFLLEFVQKLVTDSPHAGVLLSKTANLLKALYDIDLLEEDVLIKWHEKGSKKKAGRKVRKAAEPFINWLKEAEEDSDDDDDE